MRASAPLTGTRPESACAVPEPGPLLGDLLSAAAHSVPDRPAAVFSGGPTTYAELEQWSNRVAHRLRRLGIGTGHRVAFLYESSPAALAAFWATMKCGATSVDVSVLAGPATVAHVLRECAADAVAISPRQLARLVRAGLPAEFPRRVLSETAAAPLVAEAGLEWLDLETLADGDDTAPAVPRPDLGRHDPAMIIYTSGTTGRPKGVVLSADNLLSNITAVNSLMQLDSRDSLLVVVPLNFIHGRMQLLTHTLVGGTLVFSAGFHMPQNVLKEMVDHRVTGLAGVPYHYRMLLRRSTLSSTELPDLRYAVITGGALTAAELQELSQALPGVDLHVAYGQTEAAPRICNLPAEQVLERPTSCGLPVPGVTVEIAGEDGETLPTGSLGEVVVSGPNVMRGYVSGDERALGAIDEHGRLHTGDLGRFDDAGYLHLAGRCSEMIKVAGERVFPEEIETVIAGHPGVEAVAVLGAPDDLLGEQIVAFVVPSPGAAPSEKDLRVHCMEALPFVRRPRQLRLLDCLPTTSSGKPDRTRLRELLIAEGVGGAVGTDA